MNWRNLDRTTRTGRRLHDLDRRVRRLEDRTQLDRLLAQLDGLIRRSSTIHEEMAQ